MKKVDLNVDIGEGLQFDEALLEFATSANICCGEHAGSWELTQQTMGLCRSKGVRIGAHPGFPDRENMGRRIPSFNEFMDYLPVLQIQLMRFRIECPEMAYIKPHGAWYNMLCSSADEGLTTISVGILEAEAFASHAAVMMLTSCPYVPRLRDKGIEVISEGFADRRYSLEGTLVPRAESGAILEDPEEIRRQVIEIAPKVDSICLHGDTPGCLEFAGLVRKTLRDAGYEVGY